MKLRIQISIITLLAAIAVVAPEGTADIITVSHTNTHGIIVPVFDGSLGTLNSVELTITLRGGITNPGGGHNHGSYSILSTNTRSNASFGGTVVNRTTGFSAGSSYSVVTPSYIGGGLNLGNFSFGFSEPGHSHNAQISVAGAQQVGPNAFRAIANVSISNQGDSLVPYSPQTKSLWFGESDLAPFLGPTDISIAAGPVNTNVVPSHNHSLSNFNVTVGSNSGPWTWFFPASTTPSAGSYFLTLNPRFDTHTTFHFTSIPEPSSLVLLGAVCFGGVFRRQHAR